MLEVLAKVIPLNLASIISPVMLGLSVVLMSSKFHPLKKTLVYILGLLVVSFVVIYFGFNLGQSVPANDKPTQASAITNAILGLVLIFFAFKSLFEKDKERVNKKEGHEVRFFRLFVLGILCNLSNLDGLVLSLTAAKILAESTIDLFWKAILIPVNIFFLILPATLPVILYLFFPQKLVLVLSETRQFLKKFGPYIMFAVFFTFGIILLSHTWKYFYP